MRQPTTRSTFNAISFQQGRTELFERRQPPAARDAQLEGDVNEMIAGEGLAYGGAPSIEQSGALDQTIRIERRRKRGECRKVPHDPNGSTHQPCHCKRAAGSDRRQRGRTGGSACRGEERFVVIQVLPAGFDSGPDFQALAVVQIDPAGPEGRANRQRLAVIQVMSSGLDGRPHPQALVVV